MSNFTKYFSTEFANGAEIFTDVDSAFPHCSNFPLSCSAATADNCASVAHAAPGRGGQAGNKPDYRFCHIFRTNSDASSSSAPPISPTMTIPPVSVSFSNASRHSIKLVPTTGSPPIPKQVVCPRPCLDN